MDRMKLLCKQIKEKISNSWGPTGWFAVGLLGGFVLLFCAMCIYNFNLWKQLFFFSIDPYDSFMDFFNPIYWSSSLSTVYQNSLSIYPPLITLLAGLTSKLFPADVFGVGRVGYSLRDLWGAQLLLSFFLTVTISLFAYQLFLTKTGSKKERILFCLCILFSLPFLYWIERANVILLAVMSSLFFVFYYDSSKKYLRHLALLMLALAVCIKIYPAALGMLLLKGKRYKEIALLGLYVLIGFSVPLYWLGGLDQILLIPQNIKTYLPAGVAFQGFSVQAIINACTLIVEKNINRSLIVWTSGLSYVIFSVGVFSSYFIQTKWKVVALLCLLMILLPVISGTYTLLLMIIPLVLFLNDYHPSLFNRIYLLLFIIIFSFKIPFRFSFAIGNVLGADLVTGFALLTMFAMLCAEAFILLKKKWTMLRKR